MTDKGKVILFAIAFAFQSPMLEGAPSPQAVTTPNSGQAGPAGNALRFPVAHMHIGTWCMGYLYVTPDELRYEVVAPDKDKAHSFQLKRSDLKAVQPWNLFGQVQNIAEIKTSHANYHFYLLRSDADLALGRQWRVANAAAATTLLSAILNPAGYTPPNTAEAARAAAEPTPTDPAASANQIQPQYVSSQAPASATAVSASQGQPQPQYVSPQYPQNSAGAPVGGSSADNTGAPALNVLSGFYSGITISGSRVSNRYLLFTPDGWVFRDYPEDGMDAFDPAAFLQDPSRNKSWTGRYRLDGHKVHILWQDYADDREFITLNEDTASAGLDVYVPICRCDQKRLSGTYIWGLPTSGQYLQFFPDGTFLDHGATDQLFVPSPFYDHPRVLRGTYLIQNQTLTLRFADGRLKKKTFFAPKAQESQPTFDWIGLGIQRLFERNYHPSP